MIPTTSFARVGVNEGYGHMMMVHHPGGNDDTYFPQDSMLLLMSEHSPTIDQHLLAMLNTSLSKIEGVSSSNVESIINALPTQDSMVKQQGHHKVAYGTTPQMGEWEEFDMNTIDELYDARTKNMEARAAAPQPLAAIPAHPLASSIQVDSVAMSTIPNYSRNFQPTNAFDNTLELDSSDDELLTADQQRQLREQRQSRAANPGNRLTQRQSNRIPMTFRQEKATPLAASLHTHGFAGMNPDTSIGVNNLTIFEEDLDDDTLDEPSDDTFQNTNRMAVQSTFQTHTDVHYQPSNPHLQENLSTHTDSSKPNKAVTFTFPPDDDDDDDDDVAPPPPPPTMSSRVSISQPSGFAQSQATGTTDTRPSKFQSLFKAKRETISLGHLNVGAPAPGPVPGPPTVKTASDQLYFNDSDSGSVSGGDDDDDDLEIVPPPPARKPTLVSPRSQAPQSTINKNPTHVAPIPPSPHGQQQQIQIHDSGQKPTRQQQPPVQASGPIIPPSSACEPASSADPCTGQIEPLIITFEDTPPTSLVKSEPTSSLLTQELNESGIFRMLKRTPMRGTMSTPSELTKAPFIPQSYHHTNRSNGNANGDAPSGLAPLDTSSNSATFAALASPSAAATSRRLRLQQNTSKLTITIRFLGTSKPLSVPIYEPITADDIIALAIEHYITSKITPSLHSANEQDFDLFFWDSDADGPDYDIPQFNRTQPLSGSELQTLVIVPHAPKEGPLSRGGLAYPANNLHSDDELSEDASFDSDIALLQGGKSSPMTESHMDTANGSNQHQHEHEHEHNELQYAPHLQLEITEETLSTLDAVEKYIHSLYSNMTIEKASIYTEYKVIKTNIKGKRQERYFGLDKDHIYNKSTPTSKFNTFSKLLNVTKESRSISSIIRVMVNPDHLREFSISYKENDKLTSRAYEVESVLQCTDIVAKLRYLISHPQ